MIPNLFIPGAGKSGTSSLHVYLDKHPQIQMSKIKEPHNFAIDPFYEKRFENNWERSYNEIFEPDEKVLYYGESSTLHMVVPIAAERIHKEIPTAKFIFLLRDPINRILSHYNWLKSLDSVNKNFKEEISDWIDVPVDPNNAFKGNYKSYIDVSLYGKHISRFYNLFGKQNVHVVTTENLLKNPKNVVDSCYDFLNLNAFNAVYEEKTNVTEIKKMDNRPPLIKQVSALFPRKLKEQINKHLHINAMIQNKYTAYEEKYILTTDDTKWLKIYLDKDVELLKDITMLNFNEWKNFRNNDK